MAIIKHKKKKENTRITKLKSKMIEGSTMHNVNFLMESRLHKKLKTRALANDESLTEIFIRAAEDYLR